ncbi:hypothetical protein EI427_08245 [Flammeovirga pectinis]|uniref:Peptidase C14 caspase domain-containing protein n=1 Tax=Flammeovirga pectinis TaxID=2494373 RepID=A0A3Q9FMS2_9BACT|nr:hypothetical protein EI427_08245 [Flammeovirga pectinis]
MCLFNLCTKIIFVQLFLLYFTPSIFSQTYRSIDVINGLGFEDNKEVKSNAYALLIGTDQYQDFDDLKNPIYDTEGVAEVLKEDYEFEVEILKNPSKTMILNKLRAYKDKLKKYDRFILYIAGHGTYEHRYFNEGFLVTSRTRNEIKDPNYESYLPFYTVKQLTDNFRSRQVMLVVDVCFGGAFNDKITKGRSVYTKNNHLSAPQFLQNQLKERNRFVLSSSRLNPVADGMKGKHSPFAQKFIHSLKINAEDSIVTANDLSSELKTLSSRPILGHFGSYIGSSDFVFKAKSEKISSEILVGAAIKEYVDYLKELPEFRLRQKKLLSPELNQIVIQLQEASQMGNAEASFWLSLLGKRKHGIELSESEINVYADDAITKFTSELENGIDIHIGYLAAIQTEHIKKFTTKSKIQDWYTTATNKNLFMCNLFAGDYSKSIGNFKYAYKFYEQGAEQGNSFCQFELANLKYNNKTSINDLGYETDDYKLWLQKASDNGLQRAKEILFRSTVNK